METQYYLFKTRSITEAIFGAVEVHSTAVIECFRVWCAEVVGVRLFLTSSFMPVEAPTRENGRIRA